MWTTFCMPLPPPEEAGGVAAGGLRTGGWALTQEDCLRTGTLEGCLGAGGTGACWPEILVPETTLEVASASPCTRAGAIGTPSRGASIMSGGLSGASWSSWSWSSSPATAGMISRMGAWSGGASAPSTSPGSALLAWASCSNSCRKIDALGIQSQPSTKRSSSFSPP